MILKLIVPLIVLGLMARAEDHRGPGTGRQSLPDKCEPYASGNPVSVPLGHEFYETAITEDGKSAIVQTEAGKTIVIDVATGNSSVVREAETSTRSLVKPSQDGKKLFFQHEKEIEIFDPATKTVIKKIPFEKGIFAGLEVLRDGRYFSAKSSFTTDLFDAATGEKLLSAPFNIGPVLDSELSDDAKYFVAAGKDGTAKLFDVKTKKLLETIKNDGEIVRAHFPPGAKQVLVYSGESDTVSLTNLPDKKRTDVKLPFRVWTHQFSPDGKRLYFGGEGLLTLELPSGKILASKPMKDAYYARTYSPDGRFVAMAQAKGPIGNFSVFDTEKQKELWGSSVEWAMDNAYFRYSPDGSQLIRYSGGRGSRDLFDTATGHSTPLAQKRSNYYRAPLFAGETLVLEEPNGLIFIRKFKRICASPAATLPEGKLPLKAVLENAALCGKAFDASAWDRITPPIVNKKMGLELAAAYLLRFQKPGGFQPDAHLPIFLSFVQGKLHEREPDLIRGGLENIAAESPLLYEDLLKKFPALSKLPPPKSKTGECRTPDEESKLVASAEALLKYRKTVNHPTRTTVADWAAFPPLSRLLAQLPQNTKDSYEDYIGESLANSAADSPEFHGIFLSKLYKFALNSVKPWFGDKASNLTDVTVVREADRLRPILLGISPLSDRPEPSSYGFYGKALPPVPLDIPEGTKPGPLALRGLEKEIKWTHGGKKFSADIDVELVPGARDLIEKRDAPPYEALWKDKVLSGTVAVGSNLKESAESILRQYKNYYREQGFTFAEPVRETDLSGWLKKEMASGRMDYFVKEAHSDGDEKNLFRLDEAGTVLVGIKKLPDGRTEEIKLLFPDPANLKTKLIPNRDFGDWIRAREKSGNTPLVYFNGSCWSHSKAVNELQEAQSSNLINIPTLTTCYPFANYESNAFRLLLDSFRSGKSYDDMRQAMQKNSGYKARKDDVYLFPDENDYEKYVTRVLKRPIRVKVVVKDEAGKQVNIDE